MGSGADKYNKNPLKYKSLRTIFLQFENSNSSSLCVFKVLRRCPVSWMRSQATLSCHSSPAK